jgi:hypothetical protein
MKMLMVFFVLLSSTFANADVSFVSFVGTFSSGCIQSQMSGRSGFVTEAYAFNTDRTFSFTRTWFVDAACSAPQDLVDSQTGSIALGNVNTNNGFNPSGTTEAAFHHDGLVDKGLIWVSADGSKLRVATGMGTMQNTMLGLFQFSRTL